MKRQGRLIDKIAELENIRYAFYLATKGKHKKRCVQEWLLRDNEADFERIREAFLSYSVVVGKYHSFKVYEPKERWIHASEFEARIVQHAMMRVCCPIFERFQIADSYACRVGKGQYKALEKAMKNHRKTQWFVKMDVRKYFDSIDHAILKTLLRRIIKDPFVLNVFDRIIDSFHSPLFEDTNKGLPIGNLTSQYFANYYLGFVDHYIKETLHIRYYVRYMDDMVIWGNDKFLLLQNHEKIRLFLENRLQLTLKVICHNKTADGLPFLGYRIMQDRLRLTPNSKKRYKHKQQFYRYLYEHGYWTDSEYYGHIEPLQAFVKKTTKYVQ
ncbi:hypothetical protein FACS1894201_03550 [Bacteroidia bacterium]|nr:hypothetical protein FACS1894201_03550 [Bacteroidia bacterium]